MLIMLLQALEKAQAEWREIYVPGFKFYLGFSGAYFKKGLPDEQKGNQMLVG